jgi:hypothetical protein
MGQDWVVLSDRERQAARLGEEALDRALVALGHRPALDNPDFRLAEPIALDIPNAVLEKPGAAPLRFVFGPTLDIWVGPFSEVILVDVAAEDDAQRTEVIEDAQRVIEKLLRSSITCRAGRWLTAEITLQLPGDEPWRRLKVRAKGAELALEPCYAPYTS